MRRTRSCTPHVLKDGADSVGALGALNRVYLNIGLFSEEWLLHFNPVVGGKTISPIPIADAQKNSTYWQATEAGTPNTALFFLKATQPDLLKDAPGGDQLISPRRRLCSIAASRFRRNLRPLPLQQGTRRRQPILTSRRLQRARLYGLLQALLGLDARPTTTRGR